MMYDIAIKVKDILATKLGVDPGLLSNNASFADDLGADSLDVMETFLEIEKQFSITIGTEDAEKLKTVGLLIDYVIKQQIR